MAKLKDLEDLLVTALEGGSNYWYNIPTLPDPINTPSDIPASLRIFDYLVKGGSIEVHDAEEEGEVLGTLSLESMNNAFDKLNSEGRWDPDNFDAETADIFFQYAVMGEIVFG